MMNKFKPKAGKFAWEISLDVAGECVNGIAGMGYDTSSSSFNGINSPDSLGSYKGSVSLNGSVKATIGTPVNGSIQQWLWDAANMLAWTKLTTDANWNGNPSANPATGVGGIDISGIPGLMFAPLGLVAATSGTLTSHFAASQMTGGIVSGFSAIGGA